MNSSFESLEFNDQQKQQIYDSERSRVQEYQQRYGDNSAKYLQLSNAWYLELVKVTIAVSLAMIPVMAAYIKGAGGSLQPFETKWFTIVAIILIVSVLFGVIAIGLPADWFFNHAVGSTNNAIAAAQTVRESVSNPKVLADYLSKQESTKKGIIPLQRRWLYIQLLLFTMGLGAFCYFLFRQAIVREASIIEPVNLENSLEKHE